MAATSYLLSCSRCCLPHQRCRGSRRGHRRRSVHITLVTGLVKEGPARWCHRAHQHIRPCVARRPTSDLETTTKQNRPPATRTKCQEFGNYTGAARRRAVTERAAVGCGDSAAKTGELGTAASNVQMSQVVSSGVAATFSMAVKSCRATLSPSYDTDVEVHLHGVLALNCALLVQITPHTQPHASPPAALP